MGCIVSRVLRRGRRRSLNSNHEVKKPEGSIVEEPITQPEVEEPRQASNNDATEQTEEPAMTDTVQSPAVEQAHTSDPDQPAENDTTPTAKVDTVPSDPAPPPEVACLTCSTTYSEDKLLYPCEACVQPWCTNCVKVVFMNACRYLPNMPPRCCRPLKLDVVLPLLSPEEGVACKDRFEEWRTAVPTYCPQPTCSAFISNEVLNAPVSQPDAKSEPEKPCISCRKCTTLICVSCKQIAHGTDPCPDAGPIDKKTQKKLKRWGYKRCPRCRHGVRRMFGCSHMRCLCGAHFCWWCLKVYSECGGDCGNDGDGAGSGRSDSEGDDKGDSEDDGNDEENFDREDIRDWRDSGLDFGPEPADPDSEDECCTGDFD